MIRREYYWIGGVAMPEDFDKMVEKGNNQVAANVTQLNYILGIEKNINQSVKIINAHYEPSFPKYKQLFIKRRKWIRNNCENIDIGFINFPIVKRLIKIIKMKKEIKKIKIEENVQYIFFTYALTTPIVSVIPYIKRKFKNKSYVCQIVPDLPEYMEFGHQILAKRMLKKADIKVINKCIRNVDLFVLFSEKMKEKLKCENYVVIEGLISESKVVNKNKENKRENIIMYAGSLNEEYGVKNLVEAFEKSGLDNYELHLFGVGDYEEEIIKKTKQIKNIVYHGLTPHQKVIEYEEKSILLVNPRPIDKEYVMYSFPSKILEYMKSGTPLLTTKLPSIPKEYDNNVLYIENDSVNGIKKSLIKTLKLGKEELKKIGENAQEFVYREKNSEIQLSKVIGRIEESYEKKYVELYKK